MTREPCVYRAWRAPIVSDLRVGLDRAQSDPPCEPAAWVPVDLDGDVEDAVIADDGRSMWRTAHTDDEIGRSYACVEGRAVSLPDLPPVEGDPLGLWERASDPAAMLNVVSGMVSAPLLVLAAVALARTVVDLALADDARALRAVEVAEACMFDRSPENFQAALQFPRAAPATIMTMSKEKAAATMAVDGAVLAAAQSIDPGSHADAVTEAVSAAAWAAGAVDAMTPRPDLGAVVRGVIPTQVVYEALVRQVTRQ